MSVIRNVLKTAAILFAAALFCFWLQQFNAAGTQASLVFVVAVLCVARLTDGYLYGLAASVLAVFGVNYMFTYPYFVLDFTPTGYPLTFATMLAVSVSVSMLTSRIKEQEEIRLEAEKEKMRGNLLRAVSHDIRTPLTSIMGSASGIIENHQVLTDRQTMELVEDIRDEAQWLIQIVENLLSVTRINGGSAQINKQEELAEEIISSAVLKTEKRHPDIPVTVELPDTVLLVPMDGILIEQVLVNLLENSIQHGKTVSRITVRVREEDGRAVFEVEDDGEGIRKDILPKIFEGGRGSQDGGSDSGRNMGIGLSVCMSIVKAHKGSMKAENIKGAGARMTFWLPMEKERQDGY